MTSDQPRVVMLANAGHKPLDTRIFHKEALSLKQAGWEVTLIIPNSASFEEKGIRVIAVQLPKKGWEQLVKCPWRIYKEALRQPRTSIFHLHDSELLWIGLLLKVRGRKVIYDAHEDTPLQISYQHWIPWLVKGPYSLLYRLLELKAGWWFNAVIVAEPVIAKYFPKKKVILIRNFPIAASFTKPVNYSDRKNNLVYVGLLSEPRGLLEMMEAYKIALDETRFDFILGGKFAPAALENKVSGYPVTFRGWLSYEDMVNVLQDSKAGIIIPHPIKRYRTNYPVKLFEYMAAGIPVIASQEGESAEFVREANAGILVNPLDSKEAARAIVKLMKDPVLAEAMGKRGRQLIFEKYNWEKESEKLIQLYKRL